MTVRKVLVEFELDPTEYAGGAPPTKGAEPESLPDTQESATELIKAMFRGETDICDARVAGQLVLMFRGRAKPEGPSTLAHQAILGAVIDTLREFHKAKPFQAVSGPISITALPPTLGRDYYEVSVWRQPSEVLISTSLKGQ